MALQLMTRHAVCGLAFLCPCAIAPCTCTRLQTWRNWDLSRMTMHELYTQFGLDVQARQLIWLPVPGAVSGTRSLAWTCRQGSCVGCQRWGLVRGARSLAWFCRQGCCVECAC